jgi:hypothetical protein
MQCVPLFKVSHTRTTTTVKTILGQLPLIQSQNDFYMFFWNPYNDSSLLYLWKKTTDNITKNGLITFKENILNNTISGSALGTVVNLIPGAASGISDIIYGSLAINNVHVDFGYKLLPSLANSNTEFRYIEEEIAIDAVLLPRALVALSSFLKE